MFPGCIDASINLLSFANLRHGSSFLSGRLSNVYVVLPREYWWNNAERIADDSKRTKIPIHPCCVRWSTNRPLANMNFPLRRSTPSWYVGEAEYSEHTLDSIRIKVARLATLLWCCIIWNSMVYAGTRTHLILLRYRGHYIYDQPILFPNSHDNYVRQWSRARRGTRRCLYRGIERIFG